LHYTLFKNVCHGFSVTAKLPDQANYETFGFSYEWSYA